MDYAVNPMSVWFGPNFHFHIPPFQRPYGWGVDQLQGIARDSIASQEQPAHWMGVMLTQQRHHPDRTSMDVLDGQQRLITLRLWFAALEHHPAAQPLSEEFKVKSTFDIALADQKMFDDVTAGNWIQHIGASGINRKSPPILFAYYYFRYLLWLGDNALHSDDSLLAPQISKRLLSRLPVPLTEADLFTHWDTEYQASVLKGSNPVARATLTNPQLLANQTKKWNLSRFMCDLNDEPPARLFSTLNGPRLELDSFDHVRNSVFLGLEKRAAVVFKETWQPVEEKLLTASIGGARASRTSLFIYDYLISRGEYKHQGTLNLKRGASHFSKYLTRLQLHGDPTGLENLLKNELLPFVDVWIAAMGGATTGIRAGVALKSVPADSSALMNNIREISEGPPVPIVAMALEAWADGRINDAELYQSLHLVEGFLIRELLARRALSPLRSKMMGVAGELDGKFGVMSLRSALQRIVASDAEIDKHVKDVLYGPVSSARVLAILRGIERALSGKNAHTLPASAFNVEHIYPQNPESAWASDLKAWGAVTPNAELTHAIGNLTAVTRLFNPKLSNKSLTKKQSSLAQFAEPPLELHQSWRNSGTWGKKDIENRCSLLIDIAKSYWAV